MLLLLLLRGVHERQVSQPGMRCEGHEGRTSVAARMSQCQLSPGRQPSTRSGMSRVTKDAAGDDDDGDGEDDEAEGRSEVSASGSTAADRHTRWLMSVDARTPGEGRRCTLYPLCIPLCPLSAASLFFPIYHGSSGRKERVGASWELPPPMNDRLCPSDRAGLTRTTIAVQENNLNRMCLYKLGPCAVAFRVVVGAFEAAGMKYTSSNTLFNILWAKRATRYTLASLNPYQKVNHFPGTWGIGRKDSLAMNMHRMKRYFGEEAMDIVPASFILPRQEADLLSDAKRNPPTAAAALIYILKPCASSCGRGIVLHKGCPPMPRAGRQVVCQRYIGNPLLVHGRKFDLRMYCVVTAFDPLRIYLFDEGLVRFAAERYVGADQDLANIHMHLTNYSVNKTATLNRARSERDLEGDDPVDIKWCFADLARYLASHHPSGIAAWERIQRRSEDVVIKTMLSIENDVVERIRAECKDRTGRNCFELFGLDLMVDDTLKVRLIEANIMPSLATGTPLDKTIKARMLAHMLTLVRVIPHRRDDDRAVADDGKSGGDMSHTTTTRSSRTTTRTTMTATSSSNNADDDDAGRAAWSTTRGEEDETSSSADHGSHAVKLARHDTFVPHGAEQSFPEQLYSFGSHPCASAFINRVPLLKRFNDANNRHSMLTAEETLMLVEAREELHCSGGFRRIFPHHRTMHRYLPLFMHGVRRNTFLLASDVKMSAKKAD